MKEITMIKKSLVKTLQQNGYFEWDCEKSFPPLDLFKVFYNEKWSYGNILAIQVERGLSFHFGYDKTTKTSASICIDGNQYDTECSVVHYWKLAEQCIKFGCGKDYVLKRLQNK